MSSRSIVFAVLAAAFSVGHLRGEQLAVDIKFPGGSGEVESIDQSARRITLLPTTHPERGWVCWWYVRITGASVGELLTVEVGEAPWATPDRAAISSDGRDWAMTAPGARRGKRIVYQFAAPDDDFQLAWGPPFVPSDAQRLVDRVATKRFATKFELCRTRGDRPVPALRIWQGEEPAAREVWIQARQHAWESGSSWVCRGLTEWLASDDERASRLRQRVAFNIVPIMDIDNVAIGAGGKNQTPQDHNRDWSEQPHWRAVAAAMDKIRALNKQNRLDLFVDLHNPSASARRPFYYITPRVLLSDKGLRNLNDFLACSREEITGPLPYRGETHESGRSYDRNWQMISKNWVSMHSPEHVVALTLETAWNTPNSNTTGYQTVGRQLGLAIERYLRRDPRR